MDLVLHRVDGRGRINLEGVVQDGVEFYVATEYAPGADITAGSIVLTPVKVATTAVKRTTPTPETDDAPFS